MTEFVDVKIPKDVADCLCKQEGIKHYRDLGHIFVRAVKQEFGVPEDLGE